jgi:hypothetical protein
MISLFLAVLTPPPQVFCAMGVGNWEIAMTTKASGRAALMIAAGLMIGLCGALPATPSVAAPQPATANSQASAKPTPKKKAVHHHNRTAKKQATAKAVIKPVVQAPAARDQSRAVAQTEPKPLADASGALPASIANANAQASPTEAIAPAPPAANAASETAPPPAPSATAQLAPQGVVAADEVNDLDRAAGAASSPSQQQAQAAPTAAMAAAQPQAQASVASDDDAWDKASLIGKIFIAAGGLLTLASAARMFMV